MGRHGWRSRLVQVLVAPRVWEWMMPCWTAVVRIWVRVRPPNLSPSRERCCLMEATDRYMAFGQSGGQVLEQFAFPGRDIDSGSGLVGEGGVDQGAAHVG